MFKFDVNLKDNTCLCCGEKVVSISNGYYRHLKKPDKKCALDVNFNDPEDDLVNDGKGHIGRSGLINVGFCSVCGKELTSVYKNYKRIGYCHSPYKEGGYDL